MALIGLDARKYFDYGIGTYIQQLVRGLAQRRSEHSFLLVVAEEDRLRVVPPDGWSVLSSSLKKYSVGEILNLGFNVKRAGIDLFHSPHYTLPIGLRGRSVVTIHDLIHLRFPEVFNMAQRTYARGMMGHALHHSGAVITISEFTRNDILASFRIQESKVNVIHLGVGKEFRETRASEKVQEFRLRHQLDRPFVLYVGNVKPHKNIDALIDAFRGIASRVADLELVFVGEKPSHDRRLRERLKDLGSRIKELGQLGQEDLVQAYNAAEVLILPSKYEGFGLPALEAMACGTPVIVSDGGSLPEVVGNAAAIFHLRENGSLEARLLDVLKDSNLRNQMIARGRERVKQFTWEETAGKTLKVYESVLQ